MFYKNTYVVPTNSPDDKKTHKKNYINNNDRLCSRQIAFHSSFVLCVLYLLWYICSSA